jgi:hypothetical protein
MKFSKATRSSLVVIGAASLALAAGVGPASAAPTISELTITKRADSASPSLMSSVSTASPDATLDRLYQYSTPGKVYDKVKL